MSTITRQFCSAHSLISAALRLIVSLCRILQKQNPSICIQLLTYTERHLCFYVSLLLCSYQSNINPLLGIITINITYIHPFHGFLQRQAPLKVFVCFIFSSTTCCHEFTFNETQAECESEAAGKCICSTRGRSFYPTPPAQCHYL